MLSGPAKLEIRMDGFFSDWDRSLLREAAGHHTWHLFSFGGFIFDPTGQLKSREKSSMLENGPCTRNWSGLWTPVSTRSLSAFGRYLAHQTFAADTQKSWRGV